MKHLRLIAAVIFSALFVLLSCSEENITEYNQPLGAIYGRIEPAEAGIKVAAWQAAEVKSTVTDAGGYFNLVDLPPGLYTVKIEAPERTLDIRDVEVNVGTGSSLGLIDLSAPPEPLVSFSPANGATGISPLSPSITLTSNVRLDISSFDAAVAITPPIAGSWRESYGQRSYSFRPDEQLQTSTVYTVTIGEDLMSADGETWGNVVEYSFTTDVMRIEDIGWRYSGDPDDVNPDLTGRLVTLEFNVALESTSFGDAFRIEPAVEFNVELSYNVTYSVSVNIIGDLVCGTSYRIIISAQLQDQLGGNLANPDTVSFKTEPFRVVSEEYPASQLNIAPGYNGPLLRYSFNTDIDLSSAQAAVSIDPAIELIISPSGHYTNRLEIRINGGLRPATTHTLTIGPDLMATDGSTLGYSRTVDFLTQPLMIEDFRVGSSYPYYADLIIEPGDNFYCRVEFNTEVDVDSFNIAASFAPEIAGFWYLYTDYSSQYLRFFHTETTELTPDEDYTLTIDGVVGLIEDIGLGTDTVLRFVTYPVRITRLYPSPGSDGVYTYYDVEVRFNVDMEQTSTEAAFRMKTSDSTVVAGSFAWSGAREFEFNPDGGLIPGETYFITVDTSAQSVSGYHLKESGSTFFRVRQ